jgi:hypothetical protein
MSRTNDYCILRNELLGPINLLQVNWLSTATDSDNLIVCSHIQGSHFTVAH